MEERVNELLPLATKIAREFDNIPGLPHAEIELAALEALAHAARLFDPAKGDFTAYAARAMRNALRDLYDRQMRHHRHHVLQQHAGRRPQAETPPNLGAHQVHQNSLKELQGWIRSSGISRK